MLSNAKRYIENDLLPVTKLVELNRYIDYLALDRIYRCGFYGDFGLEKVTLDLNEEVDAVTKLFLAKKTRELNLLKEIVGKTIEEIAREMVVKRYGLLDSEEYISTDNSGVSEFELVRGVDVGTYILTYAIDPKTEGYLDRLATHFDFIDRHNKRMDEAAKAVEGIMGNFGAFGTTGGDTFPDPTKIFKSMFLNDEDKDPLEKEKDER